MYGLYTFSERKKTWNQMFAYNTYFVCVNLKAIRNGAHFLVGIFDKIPFVLLLVHTNSLIVEIIFVYLAIKYILICFVGLRFLFRHLASSIKQMYLYTMQRCKNEKYSGLRNNRLRNEIAKLNGNPLIKFLFPKTIEIRATEAHILQIDQNTFRILFKT